MAVIQGGQVIRHTATSKIPQSKTRVYPHDGAPVAGTTYSGIIQIGEFVEDVLTGFLYEYTEPTGTPTFTRRDTV